MEIDSEKISQLDPDFQSFMNKLPHEVREGEDHFDPTNPLQWNDIKSDIKDLLIARLLSVGEQK